MAQTTVKESRTLRIGSCKVEVGADVGSLVDIGATRKNTTLKEAWEKLRRMSANAGLIDQGIKPGSHKANVTGEFLEVNLANLNAYRGGVDNYSTVAGVEVAGHSEVIAAGAWAYDTHIPLPHQMGTGAKITPTSVTGSVDGLLVVNVDYFIAKNPSTNQWGIVIIDSATVTTLAQNITIVYTYTPAASVTLATGGKFTISPKVVRLTNTNAAGKVLRVTVFKAYNADGIQMEFLPDDDGEYMGLPFSFEGECDEALTAGAQLMEIYDEQGVA